MPAHHDQDGTTAVAELAHDPATDKADDTAGLDAVLLPYDRALTAALRDARDLLRKLASTNDRVPVDLPSVVADRSAAQAMDRLHDRLSVHLPDLPTQDEDHGRGERSAGGVHVTSWRLAAVDPADVALVAAVVPTCYEALDFLWWPTDARARRQLRSLAGVLHKLAGGKDPRQALLAPVGRLLGILQREGDEHHTALVRALRDRRGDVRLTKTQHRAFRHVAAHAVRTLYPTRHAPRQADLHRTLS